MINFILFGWKAFAVFQKNIIIIAVFSMVTKIPHTLYFIRKYFGNIAIFFNELILGYFQKFSVLHS